jgi:hypothetical protein
MFHPSTPCRSIEVPAPTVPMRVSVAMSTREPVSLDDRAADGQPGVVDEHADPSADPGVVPRTRRRRGGAVRRSLARIAIAHSDLRAPVETIGLEPTTSCLQSRFDPVRLVSGRSVS